MDRVRQIDAKSTPLLPGLPLAQALDLRGSRRARAHVGLEKGRTERSQNRNRIDDTVEPVSTGLPHVNLFAEQRRARE